MLLYNYYEIHHLDSLEANLLSVNLFTYFNKSWLIFIVLSFSYRLMRFYCLEERSQLMKPRNVALLQKSFQSRHFKLRLTEELNSTVS